MTILELLVYYILEHPGKFAYHDLEKNFPEWCYKNYSITCNAQTVGRKFRLLFNKQPIRISSTQAIIIKESDKTGRRKSWEIKYVRTEENLFGEVVYEQ